jgi:DNA primase
MSGKIPQHFIDTLLTRVDIVELISQYVPLKKKGANHMACCPFHQEKSPSFTVNQAKQFYYCFGCGAHGNAIGFLMAHDRLEFVDAIEELAKRFGMEVPYEKPSVQQQVSAPQQKTLYDHLAAAQRLFEWQLKNHPEGKAAIEYLKKRGLNGQTAKNFGLGLAPSGWDNLMQALGKTKADQDALLQAGLLIKNEQNRLYDRFRQRIMFPIRDSRGRTIGFGGRVMNPEEQPKYLNSPETPVFQKGHGLYGIFEAKQTLPNPQQLLIVEGYMDVIALAQAGIHYALATLGTATTPHHLKILLRYCDNLIFCFDGDNAGREAAWRALKAALPVMNGNYRIRFLFLPDGEDPDSLVQKEGKAAFEARYDQALSLTDFLLNHLKEQVDIKSLEGKAKFLSLIQPYWQSVPDGPYATLLKAELAKITQLSENQITKNLLKTVEPKEENFRSSGRLTLAEQAMVHVLQQPEIGFGLTRPPLIGDAADLVLLRTLLHFIKKHRPNNAGALLQQWPDASTSQRLAELAAVDHPAQQGDRLSEVTDILKKLAAQTERSSLDILIEQSKSRELSDIEKQKLIKLLQRNKK